MRRAIDRATRKVRRSAQLLEYRRLNWRVETNHRIRWEFEAFVRDARDEGFPLALNVHQFDTPNEGVIQIAAGPIPTGTVDRTRNSDWDGESPVDSPVIETGGELVASLSATGLVHFIAHTRQSKRINPKDKELILLRPYDPADVTVSLVRKVLRHYLLILQSSSILGVEDALTYRERLTVLWISFRELRNRYEFYSSLLSLRNEWGKALVAGAIAFFIGYVSGSKT